MGLSVVLKGTLWTLKRTRMGLGKTKEHKGGLWGYSWADPNEIRIRPSVDFPSVEKEADIVLHECLHSLFPDMDEQAVAEGATELAEVLRQCDLLKPEP